MEKNSFVLYLGVGFVMTLGVWGLMGGCSSDEKKEPSLSQVESKIIQPEEAVATETMEPIKPVETIQKEIETRQTVRKVKKVKRVEEEKLITHEVVKGDTLWGISRQYKTTVEEVMKSNDMNEMSVRLGQKLKIKGKVEVPHEYYVEETVEEPAGVVQIETPQPAIEVKAAPVIRQEPEKVILPGEKTEQTLKEIEKVEAKPEPIGPTMETFTGELLTHEVGSADTLVSIASKYETSIAFLQDINGLTEKSQLQEGQILLVPGK